MGICYIVGASRTAARPQKRPGDLVIAADAGYRQLGGAAPDLVVGDFDSLGYVPEGENVIRHPVRKDDTDTMLAARLGLERGYRAFAILGGLGGRLDHTIANIQTMAYITRRGGSCCMPGDGESLAMLAGGELRFAAGASGRLSVFAWDSLVTGVTLEGVEYPLSGAELSCAFPIGVSNAFCGGAARVSAERGLMLVMWDGDMSMSDWMERARNY